MPMLHCNLAQPILHIHLAEPNLAFGGALVGGALGRGSLGHFQGIHGANTLEKKQASGSEIFILSSFLSTPWSKYMAQSPKDRLIHGLYKPIHGNCLRWCKLDEEAKASKWPLGPGDSG